MFPDLLLPLADQFQPFNLFRYLTFRTGGAVMTAMILSLLIGPAFIKWLKSHQAEGQPIRSDGPESHILTKAGTPTMGGLLILGTFVVSTLLWVPLDNQYLWPVLIVAIGFGAIGSLGSFRPIPPNPSPPRKHKPPKMGFLLGGTEGSGAKSGETRFAHFVGAFSFSFGNVHPYVFQS